MAYCITSACNMQPQHKNNMNFHWPLPLGSMFPYKYGDQESQNVSKSYFTKYLAMLTAISKIIHGKTLVFSQSKLHSISIP